MNPQVKIYITKNFEKRNELSICHPFIKDVLIKYMPKDYKIFLNKSKKPYALSDIKVCPFFSITHSKNYLAIALSNYEIGIDMEHICARKKGALIAHKYFSPSEQKPELFYYAWTAREAYVKALGDTLFNLLPRISVKIISSGYYIGLNNSETHEIKHKQIDNALLAVCLPKACFARDGAPLPEVILNTYY